MVKARIQLVGRNILFSFTTDQALIDIMRRLTSRSWDRSTRAWRIPLGLNTQRLRAYLHKRKDVEVEYYGCTSQELDEITRELISVRAELARLSEVGRATSLSGAPLTSLPLFNFQEQGVKFMNLASDLHGGVLNACEVGLGKTLMTLGVIQMAKFDKVLILAPKSVLYQWKEEAKKWIGLDFVVYAGTKKEREELRLKWGQVNFIMTYETFRNDCDILPLRWDLVIADEAHRLGSTQTKLYKAVNRLTAKSKIALTATPIMNRLTELYGIVNWLSRGFLGTFTHFKEEFCLEDYWGKVTGGKNLDKLKELLSSIVFRRTVEEVEIELPPVRYEHVPVVLSDTERKLYDQIRQELLFEIESSDLAKLSTPMVLQNSLTKLGKLIELCDSSELLGARTESSKLQTLKDHLIDTTPSQKVIIFTRFSRMAEILVKKLAEYNPVLISGSVSMEDREKAVKQFNTDEDTRVLISTEAGGAGLNLQVASIVYNYDLPWSVGKLIQRTGRARRIGQDKPVLVINLVTSKTVEAHMQKLLLEKISLARDVLDNKNVFTSLDQIKEVLSPIK